MRKGKGHEDNRVPALLLKAYGVRVVWALSTAESKGEVLHNSLGPPEGCWLQTHRHHLLPTFASGKRAAASWPSAAGLP